MEKLSKDTWETREGKDLSKKSELDLALICPKTDTHFSGNAKLMEATIKKLHQLIGELLKFTILKTNY
jgi:hypothetical protein